jgi:hypothetical protein
MDQNAEAKRLLCLAAATALAVGSFMDWVIRTDVIFDLSKSGIEYGDGWLTLALGVFAAWAFLSGTPRRGAWACLAAALFVGQEISHVKRSDVIPLFHYSYIAKAGNGLYVCLVGAVIGTIAGFASKKQGSPHEELAQTAMAQDPPADSLAQLEIAGTANWHSYGITADELRPNPAKTV